MREHAEVELLNGGEVVAVTLPGGEVRRFHAIWLRDNAWDEATRAPGNRQKLITLADIPVATHVSAARSEAGRLWLTFLPENRTIGYDPRWLAEHAYDRPQRRRIGWTSPELETWDAALGGQDAAGRFAGGRPEQGRAGPLAAWRPPLRVRQAHRGAGRKRRTAARGGALRLCPGNQLRQALRGQVAGKPKQSCLHRIGSAGAHGQSLPGPGAHSGNSILLGQFGGRRGTT